LERAQNSEIMEFCARFFAPLPRAMFVGVQSNLDGAVCNHANAQYPPSFKGRATGRVTRRGGAAGRTGQDDDLQRARVRRPKEQIGKRRLITIEALRAWLLSHEVLL
jgi:hypothetical protein